MRVCELGLIGGVFCFDILTLHDAQHIGLEVTLVGQLERTGELGRLDLHVEAGFLGHGLHHLRNLLGIRRGGRHQREAGVGDAGLFEQCLGLGIEQDTTQEGYALGTIGQG